MSFPPAPAPIDLQEMSRLQQENERLHQQKLKLEEERLLLERQGFPELTNVSALQDKNKDCKKEIEKSKDKLRKIAKLKEEIPNLREEKKMLQKANANLKRRLFDLDISLGDMILEMSVYVFSFMTLTACIGITIFHYFFVYK